MKIQCSQEELRKRKLFLALPCYGGGCAGIFGRSLMDLSALAVQWGIEMKVFMLYNESLVTRARNYCADEFLRSDSTHFMFIDSDIGFKANDVITLLALADPNSDKHVLTGPYPKKTIAWEKVIQAVNKGFGAKNPTELERFVGDYVFNPKPTQQGFRLDEPVEVLEAGTGFMMIQRQVFETFKMSFPQHSYRPDHVRAAAFDGSREIMMYFQAEIDRENGEMIFRDAISRANQDKTNALAILNEALEKVDALNKVMSKRYLSEDYWFCQMVQKVGMKVWLCPWMELQHFGSITFGGSLKDLAAAGQHATADVNLLNQAR